MLLMPRMNRTASVFAYDDASTRSSDGALPHATTSQRVAGACCRNSLNPNIGSSAPATVMTPCSALSTSSAGGRPGAIQTTRSASISSIAPPGGGPTSSSEFSSPAILWPNKRVSSRIHRSNTADPLRNTSEPASIATVARSANSASSRRTHSCRIQAGMRAFGRTRATRSGS